jgi:hypothetical protein
MTTCPHGVPTPAARWKPPRERTWPFREFWLVRAEGVGFEPTVTITRHSGFQGRA